MVKCLPEFKYFTVFLKNKSIIFIIRRSKVTDYAALSDNWSLHPIFGIFESGHYKQVVLYFIALLALFRLIYSCIYTGTHTFYYMPILCKRGAYKRNMSRDM